MFFETNFVADRNHWRSLPAHYTTHEHGEFLVGSIWIEYLIELNVFETWIEDQSRMGRFEVENWYTQFTESIYGAFLAMFRIEQEESMNKFTVADGFSKSRSSL